MQASCRFFDSKDEIHRIVKNLANYFYWTYWKQNSS